MMILLTKAFLHHRFIYSNRNSIRFSKKLKQADSLSEFPMKEEQKVIRFCEKDEKSETTNDDFVNESFSSQSL